MNNKGQTMALTIISSIFIFIIGLAIVNLIMPDVDTARVALSCSSADVISDGTKLLCLAIDGLVPYWIVLIFSITFGAIAARMYL